MAKDVRRQLSLAGLSLPDIDRLKHIMLRSDKWQYLRLLLQKKFKRWDVRLEEKKLVDIKGLRILVLGIYLGDRFNLAPQLHSVFSSSSVMSVSQVWAGLFGQSTDPKLASDTKFVINQKIDKFILINRLLENINLENYDYLVVSDDDINVPCGFLDCYIKHQRELEFSLAQPSRSIHSFYDHRITLRKPWLKGRETHFVEIGPLFSIDLKRAGNLIPFDTRFPMGWGLDLFWSKLLSQHKIGIIDAVSVDHSYRPQGVSYSRAGQIQAMNSALTESQCPSLNEAQIVVKNYFL